MTTDNDTQENRHLIILTDYRNAFYSSTKNVRTHCSMNLNQLCTFFQSFGIQTEIISFSDVKFSDNWKNRQIIYQSSEDPDLKYKSYIEDIILGITLAGARVIPDFPYLRAHHNKCFFEILRQASNSLKINNINTSIHGTFEEASKSSIPLPAVLKPSYGAGSKGVELINDPEQRIKLSRKISFSGFNVNLFKELYYRLKTPQRIPYSLYRNKFIIQEYIPELDHDYKLLIYGNRFYLLERKTRNYDFRASGSGKFSWPTEAPTGLLEYGLYIKNLFNVPHISLDIAQKEHHNYLLEAQFVQFGPLTMEKSPHHWIHDGNNWNFSTESHPLEFVFAEGVSHYLRNNRINIQSSLFAGNR